MIPPALAPYLPQILAALVGLLIGWLLTRLAATGKPGKQMRFDEPGEDLHVTRHDVSVDPDFVAACRHPRGDLGFRVKGVVLHHPVTVNQVVADHPTQLRVGVRTVGAQRVEERDVLPRHARPLRQIAQHGGQDQAVRRGARDIREHDPNLVIRCDHVPQSRRPDGPLQSGFQRSGGKGQTRNEAGFHNRGIPRIREINPQPGFSVGKFDAHLFSSGAYFAEMPGCSSHRLTIPRSTSSRANSMA